MNKLIQLFLDEKHHPSTAHATGRQSKISRTPNSPNRSFLLGVGGCAILSFVLLMFSIIFSGPSSGGNSITLDPTTLCPVNQKKIVSETYIHIDLSEKLTPEQRGWLQNLLTVAQNHKLPTYSLISISQMQTISKAPRVSVQRFCIPEIGGIGVAGKSITREDCPAIAAEEFDWKQHRTRNVGKNLREKIRIACTSYVELNTKIQQAADRYKNVSVEQSRSYIVGGIEDVLHASNPRIPTQLIVFSDMLQNTDWFSQYNTPIDKWTADNLKKLRNRKIAIKEMGGKPPPADIKFNKILLCAIPSQHSVLASARNQKAHELMWKEYYKDRVVRSKQDNIWFIPASGCAQVATELMQDS